MSGSKLLTGERALLWGEWIIAGDGSLWDGALSTDFGTTMLQFVSNSPDEFEDSAALGVDWTIDASDVEAEETGKNENGHQLPRTGFFSRFSVKWRIVDLPEI